MSGDYKRYSALILAAEDCPIEEFSNYHRFSTNDEKIIAKLTAHGPVLLRGGRGSGKSALMIEASRHVAPHRVDSSVFGVYISLRHLELLRSQASDYHYLFCKLVIDKIQSALSDYHFLFEPEFSISSIQKYLTEFASKIGKRIVLFFDDAAHIGRETSLEEFFDIFRTLSSSVISCKASIYPGVTKFGIRFDVYNDATVIDIFRNEELPGFSNFFSEVIDVRFPDMFGDKKLSKALNKSDVAGFLGRSVLGNMRAFIFACNELQQQDKYDLPSLENSLKVLATNYYWPLLEELHPKLGGYAPLINIAIDIADSIFTLCAENDARRTLLVYRTIVGRLSKPFEILEYAGFFTKRDVSKAMKSGGRGSRYILSLCVLLEKIPGARLTNNLFSKWMGVDEPVEIHKGSELYNVILPDCEEEVDLEILNMDIEQLVKSNAYPYGLTEAKIKLLKEAHIQTVGELAEASDDKLLSLFRVGEISLQRLRNVVAQAIWM